MPFRTGIGRLNFHLRLWALARAIFVASLFSIAGGAQAATVQYVYDELGRLIAVIDPSADVTEYTYDEAGNLLSVSRQSSAQVSIVSFTPGRGQVGQVVTILGTAFSPDVAQNQVRFNGAAAPVTSATPTTLVTSVPLGATTGPISVTTPSGTATSAVAFVVREAPQIASFSPAIGEPGGNLTLTGRGLGEPDLSVIVNKSASQVISASAATSTSRIPTATGGKISATTVLGTATTTDDLFIVPAPYAAADVVATARIAIGDLGRALALSGGKVGLVLFDGVAGTSGIRVSLRDVTLSGGTFSIFRPDGTPLASAVSFGTAGANLVLSSLPVTGTYGLLVVANAGAGGNVTVAASTGAANSLSVGETIVISVAPGQPGSFTFNGTAGDGTLGLEVKGAIPPNGGTVSVLRPDGGTLGGTISLTPATDISQRLLGLPLTGTYTVRVQPNISSSGSVQFTLWRDVDSGTLEVGVPKTVTTTFRNQLARMTFSGTAGDGTLGIEVKNSTFPLTPTYRVDRPDGGAQSGNIPLTDSSLRLSQLLISGTYTVVVNPTQNTTGSAQFTLWKDIDGGVLQPGVPKTITISFPQQKALLSFSGTAGDGTLGIEVKNSTFPAFSSYNVFGPDGGTLAQNIQLNPDSSRRLGTLPVTGTYKVPVNPAQNSIGSVQFTLWKDVDTGTLDLDVPKTATVTFANQQVRMTFAGLIGQNLGVDIANASFGGTVQVIAPNGATQAGPTSFGLAGLGMRTASLSQSGTYTVIVVPASGATGSVQATLWSDVGGTLALGAVNSVGIVYRNQQSRMSFAGTAGQSLGLDLSNILGFTGGTMQVIAPNGGTQVSATFSTAAGIGLRTGTLTQTGNYTVIIVPASAATGTFNLRLWSDVTDSLTIGSPYQLNLAFRNQQARLPFNATAGQSLGIELSGLTLANGVQVINPNGVALPAATFTTATGIGVRLGTLGLGGTYTVVIQQAAGVAGTAAQVTMWSDVSGTLAVGAQNDVTVSFKNQQIGMTFAGVVGQNLGVDLANAAFGGTVQVIAPNGAAQSQQATFTAAGISIRAGGALAQSGTYTVIIVPASGATGGIRVTLWSDVTDALTIGSPFQLNITFRLQFAQLRFDGTAGQNLRITLTGVTLPASSTLQVLRPDGAAVVNVAFGAAGVTADIPTLTSSGVYTVFIVPGGQGTGSAVVNVLNR